MKTLYLIGGTMGVGKTTVSKILAEKLSESVFLDGDWCWDMHPFNVCDETKKMVIGNICHNLQSFINCSVIKNIVFCWVMHEQSIIDDILAKTDTNGVRVINISLICSPEALEKRLKKDIKAGLRNADDDIIGRSISRLPLYDALKTEKICVSDISPERTAQIIAKL